MSDTRRLAVWKFASCDGCQLTLLDCEDELLTLAGEVEIATFAGGVQRDGRRAVRRVAGRGLDHYRGRRATHSRDPRPVNGIDHDRRVRDRRGSSGAAQLRRRGRVRLGRLRRAPEYIDTLATSTPASAHVTVDYELRGCPIDRGQLLDTLAALLVGRKPRLPAKTVCTECKRRGVTCVIVADGIPCLGPVTHAGCGALCPRHSIGAATAVSARSATPNMPATLIPLLRRDGMSAATSIGCSRRSTSPSSTPSGATE